MLIKLHNLLLCASAALPLVCILESPGSEPEQISIDQVAYNSVGYLPGAPKIITIQAEAPKLRFSLVERGSDNVVLQGDCLGPEVDPDTSLRVFIADCSAIRTPGYYELRFEGSPTTKSIRVSPTAYDNAFCDVCHAMHLWRCGTTVSLKRGDDNFGHAACHLNDGELSLSGVPGEHKDGVGGWHDAGDFNKYTLNAAFTVGVMLDAWEQFGDRLRPLVLEIPESNNNTPDYLDEIRWELEWILKMQAEDGSVFHKLSTQKFSKFMMPNEEKVTRYFSPAGTAATASFVAVLAKASRSFKSYDPVFAKTCLEAAVRSFAFLQQHPEEITPDLSAFKTGAYKSRDSGYRLWAAAEMWRSTGRREYLTDVETRIAALVQESQLSGGLVKANWQWSTPENLGLLAYLRSNLPGSDSRLQKLVKQQALFTADHLVRTAKDHCYGRTLGNDYHWGCNGSVALSAMNLMVAYELAEDERYKNGTLDVLNYLFGRNVYGRSFVTGLGADPPRFPHDCQCTADGIERPIPGYLVGGGWPKATDWEDSNTNYKTNEIAINWNGALVYAMAGFLSGEEETLDEGKSP